MSKLYHEPIITRESPIILLFKLIFLTCLFNGLYILTSFLFDKFQLTEISSLGPEPIVLSLLFLIEMLAFLFLIIFWFSKFIIVDDHFILHKTGLLFTNRARYKLDTINHMSVDQSPISRLFRYGNIRISYSSNEVVLLKSIHYPEQLIFLIERKIEKNKLDSQKKLPGGADYSKD